MDKQNLLVCLLSVVAVVLSVLILVKVKNGCKQHYSSGLRVRDIGPSAGSTRVTPPDSFVSACNNAFSQGCASGGATVNVCGGLDSNGNMVVACQDYTDMDDQTCDQSQYVAYQPSDCSQPYAWAPGYLCGGGTASGDPPINPCPAGGTVIGVAPENVYGCTSVCR